MLKRVVHLLTAGLVVGQCSAQAGQVSAHVAPAPDQDTRHDKRETNETTQVVNEERMRPPKSLVASLKEPVRSWIDPAAEINVSTKEDMDLIQTHLAVQHFSKKLGNDISSFEKSIETTLLALHNRPEIYGRDPKQLFMEGVDKTLYALQNRPGIEGHSDVQLRFLAFVATSL
ncbi:hypothetical protein PsorP6_002982 [Peronosclerospora sorghi]|uniref:Uncharacterized protein n=1 Tax=Peronosclerospora sorghi TaxID=230839 RepID=A0ACC0VJT6_9STRA|nr:hypothetical protein PsorP6_002982 [Peronosclerospora sorghi]